MSRCSPVGKSKQLAKKILPHIDKVVMVGDEVTSREILRRLMGSNTNNHFTPHVGAFYYILRNCHRYEYAKKNDLIRWKRLK
jgi:hypothetical protein